MRFIERNPWAISGAGGVRSPGVNLTRSLRGRPHRDPSGLGSHSSMARREVHSVRPKSGIGHKLDPWEYLDVVLGVINVHVVNRLGELTPAAAARK